MLSFCFRKLILVKKFVNKIYEIYFGVNMNIWNWYFEIYILYMYIIFYCIVSGIY